MLQRVRGNPFQIKIQALEIYSEKIRWVLFSLSAGLGFFIGLQTNAGVINDFEAFDDAPKKSSVALNERYISHSLIYRVPALWGNEITGVDAAKEELAEISLSPVEVVVSDAGVNHADQQLQLGLPPKGPQYKTVRVPRLLIETVKNGLEKAELLSPELKEAIESFLAEGRESDSPFVELKIPIKTPVINSHHGSHVAGTIGLGHRDYGVSPYARITDLNVFRGSKETSLEEQEEAFKILTERETRTDVLNMSHWIGTSPDLIGRLEQLLDGNTIAVAAAGNQPTPISPHTTLSKVKRLVKVGAFGLTGTKTFFSSYGNIDLIAPGEAIVSKGYRTPYDMPGQAFEAEGELLRAENGTSMASPMVAGTFVNLKALLPEASGDDLRSIVYNSTVDLGKKGKDERTGRGLLNAYKSVLIAKRLHKMNIQSEEGIHAALALPATYSFNEKIRQLILQKNKNGPTSPQYASLLRKIALLKQDIGEFQTLADHYASSGSPFYAAGLSFSANNIEDKNYGDDETLKKLARKYAAVQSIRYALNPEDLAMIEDLVNAPLTLALYEALPDKFYKHSKLFLDKLIELRRIDLAPDLIELTEQKVERLDSEEEEKKVEAKFNLASKL